jgi:DNA topoisomerase-3
MDTLFEASFSPLAATGKNLSKCGRCLRYMRYIPMRPQVRLTVRSMLGR